MSFRDTEFIASSQPHCSSQPCLLITDQFECAKSQSLPDLTLQVTIEAPSCSQTSKTSPFSWSKSSSSSELETVNVPEDPRLFDIYTLSSGQIYQQLPSLISGVQSSFADTVMDQKSPVKKKMDELLCQLETPCGRKGCRTCDERDVFDDSDSDISVRSLPQSEYEVSGECASDEAVSQPDPVKIVVDLSCLGLSDPGNLEKWLSGREVSPSSENKSILETILSCDEQIHFTTPSFEKNEGLLPLGSQTLSLKVFPAGDSPGPSSSKDLPHCSSPLASPRPEGTSGMNEEDKLTAATDQNISSQSSDPSFIVLRVEMDERSAGPYFTDDMGEPTPNSDTLGTLLGAPPATAEDINTLSESWVDLSKSNPPTPPHPHQKQQMPSPAPTQPLGRPSSPLPAGGGSGGATGPGGAIQQHRFSRPSSPRPVPGAMDCPPIQSSSLRSSPLLQGATSSSLTEQYDSVGPLAAPTRLSQGLIFSASRDPSSLDPSTKEPVETWHHGFANGEEYLRLLKEAQKESNQSSARVSLASSRRDSPRGSPKSPPNSPNPESAGEEGGDLDQLGAVYINYYSKADDSYVRLERNTDTDWIWDWSSRPDQQPPKEWHFSHPAGSSGSSVSSHGATTVNGTNFLSSMMAQPGLTTPALLKPPRRGASLRRVMVGRSPLFSRDVLYTLLITNVLSLLLGTGLGMWLSRRSGATVTLATLPFN